MRLIVNTNRVVAALIKDSASRKILLSGDFDFLTIGIGKAELEEHRQEILEKTRLNEKEFEAILARLLSKMEVIDDSEIKVKMEEAKEIMDKIDPDDTPFIAAALAVNNDGIWSDDKHFEKQTSIKVWKTYELYKLLN